MNEYKQWIVILVLALLGGGGGNYIIQKANPPRPDPFTGSQARDMETRLSARMSSLEEQHNQVLSVLTQVLTHDASVHRQVEDHQRRLDHMMDMHKEMVKSSQNNIEKDAAEHAVINSNVERLNKMDKDIERVLREHRENRRSK